MAIVQRSYNRIPQKGYPGKIARPNAPCWQETFTLTVPSGGTNAKPGYPLYYDHASQTFQVADVAADAKSYVGIISSELTAVVSKQLGTVPHNSPQDLEFENDDQIVVVLDGITWAIAGTALEFGDRVQWSLANHNWGKQADGAANTIGNWDSRLFTCVSQSAIPVGGEFLLYASGFQLAADNS